jgi:hypothetical protein
MANWRDIVLWVLFYVTTMAALLGLVVIRNVFGVAEMLAVSGLLALVCLSLPHTVPTGSAGGRPFVGGADRLPPPGTPTLAAPSARQISSSRRPALPSPKK